MTGHEELIGRCRKKDPRAEYALYKCCFNPLMRICARYTRNEDDAAALLNKGFLKILNSLDRYDPAQRFETWIKTIMVNTIIDEFRSGRAYSGMFLVQDVEQMPGAGHPVDVNAAEDKLGVEEILEQVRKLPEPGLQVFNLFVFEGRSHKEIGEALGMPESTSRWHLATARAFLKKKLSAMLTAIKVVVL